MRSVWVLIAPILIGVSACGLLSSDRPPEDDLDDASKEWKELVARLPAAPEASELIGFYVSPTTRYRFLIDRKSIAIGADGVVRYTLVGISDEGARNTSYEGIRCETHEKKLYAIGRSDGTWAKSQNNEWELINEANANRQHAALMKDAFCPDRVVPKSVEEILSRMAQKP